MMLSPSDTPGNISTLFMRKFATHYLNFAAQNKAFPYSNSFEGQRQEAFLNVEKESGRLTRGAKFNGLSQPVSVGIGI